MSQTNPTYLSPHFTDRLRPTLSDVSRSGSEPDSLLDLYGHPRSRVESGDRVDRTNTMETLYLDDEDSEHSRWIHRDKLALIESHEMQEAGIKLPQLGGSNNKANEFTEHSHRNEGRDHDQELYGAEKGKQSQLRSSSPQQEPVETQDHALQFDLRTPEEIATAPTSAYNSPPVYRHQGLRSSSSRIPLPKSSPVPIPHEHIARNIPLNRSRGASGNWNVGDEDSISYNKNRSRSHSVGSQLLLDDGETFDNSPSTSPSNRGAGKLGQTPYGGARKATSALRNASDSQKPRTTSTTYRSSPGQRPKSRSGLETRPLTAINRPEGDPPWLATMYKPDPRLPPDQQLLPTHAKRLQQEKQEKDGTFAPTLDEDSNRSAIHNQEGPNLSTVGNNPEISTASNNIEASTSGNYLETSISSNNLENQGGSENDSAWPLKTSPTKDNGSPGLGGAEHGGYSTIPKVQSPPPISIAANSIPAQQPRQEEQVPKERGCRCCVVM